MNQSKQLKIWILLTQAFIVIGAGHGIAPLLLVEAAGAIRPFKEGFFEDKLGQAVFLFSIMTFVGQLVTIYSIYSKSVFFKKRLQIVGVSLLFIGTLFICSVVYFDPSTVALYVTCLPFVICVFLTMFGKYFGNVFRRTS
jgi:hypothetical protein